MYPRSSSDEAVNVRLVGLAHRVATPASLRSDCTARYNADTISTLSRASIITIVARLYSEFQRLLRHAQSPRVRLLEDITARSQCG